MRKGPFIAEAEKVTYRGKWFSPKLPEEHEGPSPPEPEVQRQRYGYAEDIANPLNHLEWSARGGSHTLDPKSAGSYTQ